jgi:hypothetical protein
MSANVNPSGVKSIAELASELFKVNISKPHPPVEKLDDGEIFSKVASHLGSVENVRQKLLEAVGEIVADAQTKVKFLRHRFHSNANWSAEDVDSYLEKLILLAARRCAEAVWTITVDDPDHKFFVAACSNKELTKKIHAFIGEDLWNSMYVEPSTKNVVVSIKENHRISSEFSALNAKYVAEFLRGAQAVDKTKMTQSKTAWINTAKGVHANLVNSNTWDSRRLADSENDGDLEFCDFKKFQNPFELLHMYAMSHGMFVRVDRNNDDRTAFFVIAPLQPREDRAPQPQQQFQYPAYATVPFGFAHVPPPPPPPPLPYHTGIRSLNGYPRSAREEPFEPRRVSRNSDIPQPRSQGRQQGYSQGHFVNRGRYSGSSGYLYDE